MKWYNLSIEETLHSLETSVPSGLSLKEVKKRQQKYGENKIEVEKQKNFFEKYFQQFGDFMIITLILAAAISFLVSFLNGDADFVDPVIILIIININALLGVIQETKAERSLQALQKLSSPSAIVRRENIIQTIASSQLVPGDIILLEPGQFVPADGRLITAINLKVEESSLTGESHPVTKHAQIILPKTTPLGDRHNLVMATSIISYGRGSAIVTNTGMDTQVGHIAKLIMTEKTPDTPLQKRLAKTGKVLGTAALLICVCIFVLGVWKERPIFDMFMTSVSLAVAAIPEGLPAIVTIMLSLGVQRMAKKNAVIRKLPAVETLGSATVICSDKTGTLTQNKMTITQLYSCSGKESLDSNFSKFALSLATLCNNSTIQFRKKEIITTGEPTERALTLAAHKIGLNISALDLSYPRINEIPFDSSRKRMTTLHKMNAFTFRMITKGAPDMLLSRCSNFYYNGKETPLTKENRRTISKFNESMAQKSLRVIAVAYQDMKHLPKRMNPQLENTLTFVGLIGMMDPPREEVRPAILTCKMAGIKPVMVTGDHIVTACAIGFELGMLNNTNQAITGADLDNMTDQQLKSNINLYRIFARVSPEHKVRIVKAFQSNGEVVAMTGDGVNDAPALKTADIGCAMGVGGTDVAKNAADMILTDDNFATIVEAIKEGRGIYDNIKKSLHFLLSCNIGELITIFVAILFGLPSPLIAVQLLWVNLVTDSLPAISLGVEPPEKNIMKKAPIPSKQGMFANGLVFKIIFEGAMIGFLALFAYTVGNRMKPGDDITLGRTMCFAVLSLSQLFHSFNMRSEFSLLKIGLFSNLKLLFSFILCTLLQFSVIMIKPFPTIFKVTPLNANQWIIVFILSFIPIIVVELQKKSYIKK
jgi:P-type Ca2+ transporter type 2C